VGAVPLQKKSNEEGSQKKIADEKHLEYIGEGGKRGLGKGDSGVP